MAEEKRALSDEELEQVAGGTKGDNVHIAMAFVGSPLYGKLNRDQELALDAMSRGTATDKQLRAIEAFLETNAGLKNLQLSNTGATKLNGAMVSCWDIVEIISNC